MTTTTPTEPQTLDAQAILANARAIAPVLREQADESERLRRLTPRTVETLRAAGAFRMSMPRAWGGPEIDICTQIEIVEELSHADGSAGWCVMIGSDSGFYSSHLDDDVGRRLFPDLDMITAGWIQPGGELRPVDGGYRLSGRWQFGSGCTHADVIVGGAIVLDGDHPAVDRDGFPETRIAVLPADRFTVLDTWDTTGLAGTGSHDYTADDVFVPADQTLRFRDRRREGTLYAWPSLFYANFAAVPLGIARAALDTARDILAGKIVRPEMRPARDDPRVRTGVAQATAMVSAARSYVFDVLGDAWATLETGAELATDQRAALGTVHGWAARTCRDAVRLLADTIGTDSVRRASPIERHQRDLSTLCHHIITQQRFLEVVGALLLDGASTDHYLFCELLL
ncbi:MAG TPA: acyl-CoA dehydrogenase family protein [Acidimicrobiales bacterium]